MLGPRHTIARLQSDFYRYKYYKILRWVLYALVIIALLLLLIIYLLLVQPTSPYYASTTDGKILNMPPPKIVK